MHDSTYIIRPMSSADLEAARELWATAEGVSISEGDSPEELQTYLARNPGASQVAYAEGSLVGAVLAGHDGRRGYIYHLAVHPSQRGKGLGKELTRRSLDVLKQAGLQRVLILVASDNDSGRAFWERCGWEGMPFAKPMGIDL